MPKFWLNRGASFLRHPGFRLSPSAIRINIFKTEPDVSPLDFGQHGFLKGQRVKTQVDTPQRGIEKRMRKAEVWRQTPAAWPLISLNMERLSYIWHIYLNIPAFQVDRILRTAGLDLYCLAPRFHFFNGSGYKRPGYGHAHKQNDQDNKDTDVSEDECPDNPGPVVLQDHDARAVLIFF